MEKVDVIRGLRKNKTATIGLILIAILMVLALVGPTISPFNPLTSEPLNRLRGPSWNHPFGTDSLGRDILSRIIYGSRISIIIGLIAVSISLVPGTILGLLSGFYGKYIDEPVMRFMDIMLAFPAILLAIFITAILGPSLLNTMIAVGIVYIPHYARVVRSSVLSLREQLFVEAVKSIGGSNLRIIALHIFPNTIPPIIVYATLGMGTAVLQAAALGVFGSWGTTSDAGMGSDAERRKAVYPECTPCGGFSRVGDLYSRAWL